MRIQILPLPSVMNGDHMEEPFALVVDQWPHDRSGSTEDGDADAEAWGAFAAECGARSVIATRETAEVVDPYAEPTPRETTPTPEPEPAPKPVHGMDAILFNKRVRLEWPDGIPPGINRQQIAEALRELAGIMVERSKDV